MKTFDYADIAVSAEKELGIPYNSALSILKSVRFIPFYEDHEKEIYSNYANDYVSVNNPNFEKFDQMINAFLKKHNVEKAQILG